MTTENLDRVSEYWVCTPDICVLFLFPGWFCTRTIWNYIINAIKIHKRWRNCVFSHPLSFSYIRIHLLHFHENWNAMKLRNATELICVYWKYQRNDCVLCVCVCVSPFVHHHIIIIVVIVDICMHLLMSTYSTLLPLNEQSDCLSRVFIAFQFSCNALRCFFFIASVSIPNDFQFQITKKNHLNVDNNSNETTTTITTGKCEHYREYTIKYSQLYGNMEFDSISGYGLLTALSLSQLLRFYSSAVYVTSFARFISQFDSQNYNLNNELYVVLCTHIYIYIWITTNSWQHRYA